jgi:predicted dehydrogenase
LEKPAERIAACGRRCLQSRVEDMAHVQVEYAGGVSAHFHVSWLSPVKVRRMTIGGTQGTLAFDDLDAACPIVVYDHRAGPARPALRLAASEGPAARTDLWRPPVEPGEPLAGAVRHFAECILGKQAPTSDGWMGWRVVRALEAADESLRRRGAWVPTEDWNERGAARAA